MIFIVDDDAFILKLVQVTLEAGRHQVETFTSAALALERARVLEPEIIISDVRMPEMDGYQFRRAYVEEFPSRHTTFVFLTALSDPTEVARGLDAGADDYLEKPLDRRVLASKVNALLRRQRRVSGIFHGVLSNLSAMQVLRACERQKLTGEVTFSNGQDEQLVVALEAGQMAVDAAELDAVLDRLNRLDETVRFVVRARPPDFRELQVAPQPSIALGKISTLHLGTRVFSLQTEVSRGPNARITTAVFLDGRVVKTRVEAVPDAGGPSGLQRSVEAQHSEVERSIQEKVDALVRERSDQPTTAEETRAGLIELGYQRWREKDLEGALQVLEQAHRLAPDDRIISANLKLLRQRLAV